MRIVSQGLNQPLAGFFSALDHQQPALGLDRAEGLLYACAILIGWLRQKTASAEPPRAIKTTLTADGIATNGSGKCFCASRNPSAALCMPASTPTTSHGKCIDWSAGLRLVVASLPGPVRKQCKQQKQYLFLLRRSWQSSHRTAAPCRGRSQA